MMEHEFKSPAVGSRYDPDPRRYWRYKVKSILTEGKARYYHQEVELPTPMCRRLAHAYLKDRIAIFLDCIPVEDSLFEARIVSLFASPTEHRRSVGAATNETRETMLT
jgi:hypothetical protein